MKHKAKSFIAVLLALCLMMSLGVGALADGGSEGDNSVPTLPGDVNLPDVGDPGDGGGSNPPEPRVGTKYLITCMTVEGNGEVTASVSEAAEGTEVTLTVTPDEGYRLEHLNILKNGSAYADIDNDNLEDGKYTFEMPASVVIITAIFEQVYKITVNPSDNGSVTASVTASGPASVTEAAKDDHITLTVTPYSGYKLDSLTVTKTGGGDVTVTANKYFKMPDSNVTVTATFEEIEDDSENPNPGGDTDPGDTPEGDHKINVQPSTGGTVKVESVMDLTASYVDTNNPTSANENWVVIFSVTPDSDYELAEGWPKVLDKNNASVTVSSALKDGEYQFKMPASDVTISAVFQEKAVTPETHTITVVKNPNKGGTVTVDKQTAQAGDTVTFTVEPADGYEIGTVVVAGASKLEHVSEAEGKYSFKMPASKVEITVNFNVEVQYDITVDDDIANGSVLASADRAAQGTPVTLTAVPDTGYVLDKYTVTMGGIPVIFTGDTFTMPDGDVTVTATFKLKQDQPDWSDWYNIDTWSNSVDGGISVGDDADMALAGSTVTFRVWHNYRYDYYDYDVYVLNDRTGNRVSLDYSAYDDEYSFTMPEDDVTIYVYFDYAGRYSITKDVEGDGSIYVRSSADKGDTVWIEASPNAGQSLTSLRVFYGEPWAYGDKGYYGYWDEAEVKYSTYWDAYYFTMPADAVVVYARFTDGATVDVVAGDHGDAKVSSRYADKGDWVYITAYPDEGYEVDSVTVTDSLGRSVKVTELSYDYFLFTMPGTSVDVKVTFRAKDYDVFYDVSRGDWYYKAVRFVHEKGIMEGTGTHYFSPEADLSRGMLATILYRLEGSPSVSGYSGFADVADTAYYAKAVAWAKANGIVNGVTATAYEPDTAVTREELAAILCRYAAFKGKDTAISYDYLAGFSDANTSHVYARPALNWAVAYDIINGQGNGVLAPRATATRAEVAQVLMNYLEVFD